MTFAWVLQETSQGIVYISLNKSWRQCAEKMVFPILFLLKILISVLLPVSSIVNAPSRFTDKIYQMMD